MIYEPNFALVDELLKTMKKNDIYTDDEKKIAREFIKKLLESQKDIDPEIAAIVKKHFWEMI